MYVHDAMVEVWNIYCGTRIVSVDDCTKDGLLKAHSRDDETYYCNQEPISDFGS